MVKYEKSVLGGCAENEEFPVWFIFSQSKTNYRVEIRYIFIIT